MTALRTARGLAPGEGDGSALVLREPLSFWGGIDPATGRIIDRSHPDAGRTISGSVLVMPGSRGSSSSSSVLAETLRLGTGPVAIVLGAADPILTVGAIVADRLYGLRCPIVVCEIDGIGSGDRLRITCDDSGRGQLYALQPEG
jgi:predicted aconitase with swiveling domain